jgi:predicted MFS family arabinose efflux permease
MLGIGEMLGGIFMGKIVDRYGSKTGVIWNVITVISACLISLWQIERNKFDWLSFIFTFAWGFSDGAINTHSN